MPKRTRSRRERQASYKGTLIEVAGRQLAELRKDEGLTQVDLGDLLDTDRERVAEWERGSIGLNLAKIEAIASALGYRVRLQFVRRSQ